MNLKDSIKYVIDSVQELDIDVDGNMILDCATRLFISENISNSKKENIQAMKEKVQEDASQKGKTAPPEPPTEKQVNYLKKMGIRDIPKSKKVCQEMIKQIIENKNNTKISEDY
jgi:hypothetical protein